MKLSRICFGTILVVGMVCAGLFCVGLGRPESKPEPSIVLNERVPAAAAQETLARPSQDGALKVKGARLVNKKGHTVQLRGISTHGLAWFPQYVNQKCFNTLSKWGINVIRLALYTDEYGGYCNGGDQKELEALIKKGVRYAKKADLYVIIDWHILSDSDPNTHKKEAKRFFKKMSKAFSKNKNVLYEICNEPNGGTTWSRIKTYAKSVIPVIRKNDKSGVIIVGTPNWSQYVDQAAESPIKGYKNLMYAFHFYAGTHREDMQKLLKSAIEAELPVFVTEFGLCDASGNGGLDKASSKKWLKLLDKYQISYVNWSLCNKDETASLLKSSVTKTSGFKRKDLSDGGKWYYQWLSKKSQ